MMKKALVVLLLAAFVVPAFADDAITLPQGVMRTRVIPSMTIVNQVFDDSGDRQDTVIAAPGLGTASSVTLYTLSFAVEYGITDWLTAGVQWVPGWRFASNIDFETLAPNDNVVSTGVSDLFVGAKMQILGPRALVPNQQVRFAVTPGIKIPLSSYDNESETDNFAAGDDFRLSGTDRGAFGLGGRLAFDYLITPDFYINVYNQSTFFLETEKDLSFGAPDVKVQYGPELIFEVEAAYSMDLGGGIRLGLGLPVTYQWTGETKIEGTGADDVAWTFGVGPNVSLFFTQWALPMEFELGYSVALMGENANAANTISLQIKNFLRF